LNVIEKGEAILKISPGSILFFSHYNLQDFYRSQDIQSGYFLASKFMATFLFHYSTFFPWQTEHRAQQCETHKQHLYSQRHPNETLHNFITAAY
jgi:hypothetical protein